MTPARRWPASTVGIADASCAGVADAASVCATVWPTRSLQGRSRWFDELYLWPEGFEPSPPQWSAIQLHGLQCGLGLLAREESDHIGVTLSFGTVQKFDEQIDALLRARALVAHRLLVILRGSVDHVQSSYRIRAFVEYLRAQQIPVGLRVTEPRMAMQMSAFSLVQPEFAKVLAPQAVRGIDWHNLALEARVAGISEQWLIVAGLQNRAQVELAVGAGIGFGQGSAVRPAHRPEASGLLEKAALG